MFDVSALLSLKPAAPALDQVSIPGMEALQTSSFSQVLSTQLETSAPTLAAPETSPVDLAALAVAADAAGKRQTTGKILPDALPDPLAILPDAAETKVAVQEAIQIKPLDKLLANRIDLKTAQQPAKSGRRAEAQPATAETPKPKDEVAAADALSVTVDQPVILAALVQPAVPTAIAITPPTAEAPAPSSAPAQTAAAPVQPTAAKQAAPSRGKIAVPPAILQTIAAAATEPATKPAPAIAAQTMAAPAGSIAVSAAALATIGLPQPVVAKELPASATIPATASTIALVAAQAQQATSPATVLAQQTTPVASTLVQQASIPAETSVAPASPSPSNLAAQSAPASPIIPTPIATPQPTEAAIQVVQLATAPLPTLGAPVLPAPVAAPVQPDAPVAVEAEAATQVAAPAAERPAVTARNQRAQAKVATRASAENAVPAAPAAASQSAERSAPVAPVSQPATILGDMRQPVVSPAIAAVTATPSETPQDFVALVDRLIAARDTAGVRPVQATISHAEFGRVALDFRQDSGNLTVSMSSADPGFAPAVLAAMAADKPAPANNDAAPIGQPQVQAIAQAQASSQSQMQNQNQGQSQNQSQQQQPSGNGGSAQFHQDASGQRGADGSGAQNRGGQDRSARYQPNPSPSGRDNGSSQTRKGTYA